MWARRCFHRGWSFALDSTTIDLCLSLFDGAPFRSTKVAIKLHTLLDLHGALPAFIHKRSITQSICAALIN